ncbi:MAG: DUF3500 domain-containing protein [Chitinophagaceae bacterium]
MNRIALLILIVTGNIFSCSSQTTSNVSGNMTNAAKKFFQSLSATQRAKAQFAFDDTERINWHYIPRERKGIPLRELTAEQRKAGMDLLHTALSDTGFNKAIAITQLELVLREVENRPANDDHRNPEKYYFSVFGDPASDPTWGWRFEGHHVSFNFCSKNNQLVSATPGFLGTNPAVVLSGPEKGKQILKDEKELGFALLQSLNAAQMEKAIINKTAPGEILTAASRKAMLSDLQGILYSELKEEQQKIFIQLLSIYIHRYTRLFANNMMKEIETAGLNNLRFAWAGEQLTEPGHPHYYRIQGPTIIIEYDNTQNNANHVHTVVRDLKNDFGGDELMEHYKSNKH